MAQHPKRRQMMSVVKKYDCRLLQMRIYEVQDKIMTYAIHGFPEKGFHSDTSLRIALLDLKKTIEDILEKDKKND